MNCLVTKLQGVVSDTTLARLGEIRILIDSSSVVGPLNLYKLPKEQVGTIEISTIDGLNRITTTSDGVSNLVPTITLESANAEDKSIYFAPGKYEVSILPKNAITYFNFNNAVGASLNSQQVQFMSELVIFKVINTSELFDISYIDNCPKLQEIRLKGANNVGNFNKVCKLIGLKVFWLYQTSVADNVEKLSQLGSLTELTLYHATGVNGNLFRAVSNMPNLQIIEVTGCVNLEGNLSELPLLPLRTFKASNTMISGDISNLGNLTTLNTIDVAACPNIIGTIEGLVQSFRDSGKASGNLTISSAIATRSITYQGIALNEWMKQNLGSAANAKVTWDSNTITISA